MIVYWGRSPIRELRLICVNARSLLDDVLDVLEDSMADQIRRRNRLLAPKHAVTFARDHRYELDRMRQSGERFKASMSTPEGFTLYTYDGTRGLTPLFRSGRRPWPKASRLCENVMERSRPAPVGTVRASLEIPTR